MNDTVNLKNRRAFFVGVNTGFVTGGEPDERCVEFYGRRSSPDLHCAIVGNIVVPGGYGSNAVTPVLTGKPIWARLASAIRAGGALPGIQLATTWDGYAGSRNFVAAEPDRVIAEARHLVSDMGREGIATILDSFDAAANIASRHGFDHVQLHAAHGYLLSLLVDARINGDAAFVLDRLAALACRLGQEGLETSIRISLRTGDSKFDSEGSAEFQDTIAGLPFDYVDLSSGFYNIDKRLIYPTRPDIISTRLEESLAAGLRHPDRRFILSGRALQHNWADFPPNIHLGVCRDLIANPNFLQETNDGCHNHNKCHYFSRGDPHLTCGRWIED